jgi:hypothetical protein
MTVGFGLFINLQPYASWSRIIIFQIIAAAGIGPNFQAPLIALQTKLAPKDIATGTSTFGFTRTLSCSIGLVIGQVVFQSQMQRKSSLFLKAGISPHLVSSLSQGSALSSVSAIAHLPPAQHKLVREATTESLSKMWILYTVMSFIGFLAGLGISKQELSKQHEEHKTGLVSEKVNVEPKPMKGEQDKEEV